MSKPRKPHRLQVDLNIDEIVRLYNSGMHMKKIAEMLSTTPASVRLRLVRSGIAIRRSGWRRIHIAPNLMAIAPSTGLTDQTRAYFKGSVTALRAVCMDAQAEEIERDADRLDELGRKYGFGITANALRDPSAVME